MPIYFSPRLNSPQSVQFGGVKKSAPSEKDEAKILAEMSQLLQKLPHGTDETGCLARDIAGLPMDFQKHLQPLLPTKNQQSVRYVRGQNSITPHVHVTTIEWADRSQRFIKVSYRDDESRILSEKTKVRENNKIRNPVLTAHYILDPATGLYVGSKNVFVPDTGLFRDVSTFLPHFDLVEFLYNEDVKGIEDFAKSLPKGSPISFIETRNNDGTISRKKIFPDG